MSLLDKFRKKHEAVGQEKKPQNVVKASDTPKEKKVEPKEEKPAKAEARVLKSDTRHAYRVLLRPLITEKATRLQQIHQYTFAVAKRASKVEIAQAIHATYGVRPIMVRTQVVHGKAVRFGRMQGSQKEWKKAIVSVPADKHLNLSE